MPRKQAMAGEYMLEETPQIVGERAHEIMHYAYCHKNLKFGWDFAAYMASTTGTFPAFLHNDDLFLWRAYKFIQGFPDATIAGALAMTTKAYQKQRNDMNTLILNAEVKSHAYIADTLSIPEEIVIAYEKLFFNVFDRKKDHEFIASITYPEGRMVEALADYLEKTGVWTLMLRAGYNNHPDVGLYLMGIGKHPYRNYDAATGAKELDKMFMQDGILYAASGFQNVDNAVPLKNARLSIQAGKMGNNDDRNSGSTFILEDTIRQDLIELSELKAVAAAEAQEAQLGNVALESPKEH